MTRVMSDRQRKMSEFVRTEGTGPVRESYTEFKTELQRKRAEQHQLDPRLKDKIDSRVSDTDTVIEYVESLYADLQLSSDVIEHAVETLVTYIDRKPDLTGCAYTGMVTGSVMISLKKHDVALREDEVISVLDVERKSVRKRQRDMEAVTGEHYMPVSVDAWFARVCEHVCENVPERVLSDAEEHVSVLKNTQSSRSPSVLAASAVWCAVSEFDGCYSVTQADIADSVDATTVSVRNCANDFFSESTIHD